MPRRSPHALVLASTASPKGSDPPLCAEQFEALWSRFKPFVRGRVFLRLGGARRFVDDVVQEVALVLWRAVQAGRLPAAEPCVFAFLRQTVDYQCGSRALRRARRDQLLFASGSDDEERRAAQPELPSEVPVADVLRECLELREHVAQLPLLYKEVVALALLDLEPAEIAERLGLKATTVRVRLHRARLLLAAKQASSDKSPTGLARFVRRTPSPMTLSLRRYAGETLDKCREMWFTFLLFLVKAELMAGPVERPLKHVAPVDATKGRSTKAC